VDGNREPPSPNTLSSIWNFGGATARVGATDTAFGDRSMPYMLSIDSIWQDPHNDARNIDWTRAFWQRMLPYAQQGRIYLNFAGLGEDGLSLVQSSFGGSEASSPNPRVRRCTASAWAYTRCATATARW
jgi:hypothetical protein